MFIKKVDFIIIVLFILVAVLLLDNFYFGQGFFSIDDLHHETWIVALAFGGFLLLLFRKRL